MRTGGWHISYMLKRCTNIQVDVEKDDEHPVVTVRTKKLADRLGLNASASIFQLHEGIGISLGAICVGNAPELISDHEAKLSVEGNRFIKLIHTNALCYCATDSFQCCNISIP